MVGEKIYVRFFGPLNGRKEAIGILHEVKERVSLSQLDGDRLEIPFEKIAKASFRILGNQMNIRIFGSP